ncbi:MAG TPA: hypothetical protein VFS21_29685 [Roseiflexaceae bacterium]|nr:hypothetical protein [Roseiflexaceae bacterium]
MELHIIISDPEPGNGPGGAAGPGNRRPARGQPSLLDLTAGPAPAHEEQLLAALPSIIAALHRQGVAEEELFPAVVAALRAQVGSGERAGEG